MKKILIGLTLLASTSSFAQDYCTYRFDVGMDEFAKKNNTELLSSLGFQFDPASPYKLKIKKHKPSETFLSKLNPITAIGDAIVNNGIGDCNPNYDLQQQQCFPKANSGTFIHITDYIISDDDGKNIAKLRQKGESEVEGYQSYGYEVVESRVLSQKCITLKN
jgi:hypothetical protein